MRRNRSLPTRLAAACLAMVIVAGNTPLSYADGIPQGQQSGAIAQDPATGQVYLAQPFSDSLFILTSKGLHLLAVLRMPPSPSAIAVDPDHHFVYVASDPAGMISVIDSRTFRVVRIYPLGGHPDGLTLLDHGATLLISDGASGAVQRLSVQAHTDQPQQVFSIGPAAAAAVLFAPTTVYPGQDVLAWARGFRPGEPIDIDWGIQPLLKTRAGRYGIVKVHVAVPAQTDLGLHLVIINGKWSTTSKSGLLNVVRAPVVRKRKKATPSKKPVTPALLALLTQTVAVPIPPFLSSLTSLLLRHQQPAQANATRTARDTTPRTTQSSLRQTKQTASGRPPRATPGSGRLQHPANNGGSHQQAIAPTTPTAHIPLLAVAAVPLLVLVGLMRRLLRRRGRRRKVKREQQKEIADSASVPARKAS